MPPHGVGQGRLLGGRLPRPSSDHDNELQQNDDVYRGNRRQSYGQQDVEDRLVEDTNRFLEQTLHHRSQPESRQGNFQRPRPFPRFNDPTSSTGNEPQSLQQNRRGLSPIRHPSVNIPASSRTRTIAPPAPTHVVSNNIRDHGISTAGARLQQQQQSRANDVLESSSRQQAQNGALEDVLMRGRALKRIPQNGPYATTQASHNSHIPQTLPSAGILKRKPSQNISTQPTKISRQVQPDYPPRQGIPKPSEGYESEAARHTLSRGLSQAQQIQYPKIKRSRSKSQPAYRERLEQQEYDDDVIITHEAVARNRVPARHQRQSSPIHGQSIGRSSAVVPQPPHNQNRPFLQNGVSNIAVVDLAGRSGRPRSPSRPQTRLEDSSRHRPSSQANRGQPLSAQQVQLPNQPFRGLSRYPSSFANIGPEESFYIPDEEEDSKATSDSSLHTTSNSSSPTSSDAERPNQSIMQRRNPVHQSSVQNGRNGMPTNAAHATNNGHRSKPNISRQGPGVRASNTEHPTNQKLARPVAGQVVANHGTQKRDRDQPGLRAGPRRHQRETSSFPQAHLNEEMRLRNKAISQVNLPDDDSRPALQSDSDGGENILQAMRVSSKRARIMQNNLDNNNSQKNNSARPSIPQDASARSQIGTPKIGQPSLFSDEDSVQDTNSSDGPGRQAGLVMDPKYSGLVETLRAQSLLKKKVANAQPSSASQPHDHVDVASKAKALLPPIKSTQSSLDIFGLGHNPVVEPERQKEVVEPPELPQVDNIFEIQDPVLAGTIAPLPLTVSEDTHITEVPTDSFQISFEPMLVPETTSVLADAENGGTKSPLINTGDGPTASPAVDAEVIITESSSRETEKDADAISPVEAGSETGPKTAVGSGENTTAAKSNDIIDVDSHSSLNSDTEQEESADEVKTLQAEVATLKKRTEAIKAKKAAKEAKKKADEELQAAREVARAEEMRRIAEKKDTARQDTGQKVSPGAVSTKASASSGVIDVRPSDAIQLAVSPEEVERAKRKEESQRRINDILEQRSSFSTRPLDATDTTRPENGGGMSAMSMAEAIKLMGRSNPTSGSKRPWATAFKKPLSAVDKIRNLAKKQTDRLKTAQSSLTARIQGDKDHSTDSGSNQSFEHRNTQSRTKVEINPPILLDKVSENDMLMVELKLQGLTWKEIHAQFVNTVGETRTLEALRKRWRRLQNTFPELAESTNPVSDSAALSHINYKERISELCTNASNAAQVAAESRPRPTTGGKTITPEMERMMNETIYYDEESEDEREDSPITDEDRVHYVYFLKRQIVLSGDEIDDDDDEAWVTVGQEYTSLSEANKAATKELGLKRGSTYIVPDKWSFEHDMGMARVIGSSDEGKIYIFVDRRLRDFNEAVLPKHKQGWLPRKVWDVCETRIVTVTTACAVPLETEAGTVEDITEAEAVEDIAEALAAEDFTEAEAVEGIAEALAVEGIAEALAADDFIEPEAVEGSTESQITKGAEISTESSDTTIAAESSSTIRNNDAGDPTCGPVIAADDSIDVDLFDSDDEINQAPMANMGQWPLGDNMQNNEIQDLPDSANATNPQTIVNSDEMARGNSQPLNTVNEEDLENLDEFTKAFEAEFLASSDTTIIGVDETTIDDAVMGPDFFDVSATDTTTVTEANLEAPAATAGSNSDLPQTPVPTTTQGSPTPELRNSATITINKTTPPTPPPTASQILAPTIDQTPATTTPNPPLTTTTTTTTITTSISTSTSIPHPTPSPNLHTHLDMANRHAATHYLSTHDRAHRSHLRRTYELGEQIKKEREEMDDKLRVLEEEGERFAGVVVWEGCVGGFGAKVRKEGMVREEGGEGRERVEIKIEVVERVLIGPRNL